jgi:NOL1/NOP2/sun family putative RNA methylase
MTVACPADLDLSSLERYRPLVDDWPAFVEALRRPLPTVVWANPGRVSAEDLGRRLAALGFEPEPLPWLGGALRLGAGAGTAGEAGVGATIDYAAGLYHVQEEVSLLPPLLLAPRPGDRVLDLCAAPGNKTARIAAAMAGRGTLVANDVSRGRLGPLRRALARLGALNVAVTCADGAGYPPAAGGFDRVLVDVPCSCEGTSRKNPEVLERDAGAQRRRLGGLQRALLAKAVGLARPGGRIVYATCTYAPEENELVVDELLAAEGGRVRVVAARVEGLRGSPGVTSWGGRRLDAALAGCLRVWPHHDDTGGFFLAVLEKAADAPPAGDRRDGEPETALPAVDPELRERCLGYIERRFGIAGAGFAGLELVPAGRLRRAIAPRDLEPPERPEPETIGLPFVRIDSVHPKPTTAAAMAFGAAADRNVFDVDLAQARAFLAGEPFAPRPGQDPGPTAPGWVLVRLDGCCLGVGRLGGPAAGRRVESLYPKGWRLGAP